MDSDLFLEMAMVVASLSIIPFKQAIGIKARSKSPYLCPNTPDDILFAERTL